MKRARLTTIGLVLAGLSLAGPFHPAAAPPPPPGPPAAAKAAGAGKVTLAIDAARSELHFTITRPGETIEGTAHLFTGDVGLDPERPEEGSSVVLNVRAESLETGNRMRDRKMRNSHLEVERFPEIAFRSTSIRLGGAGGASASAGTAASTGPSAHAGEGEAAGPLRPGAARKALVEGVLSLHGVERTLLFPVVIKYDGGSLTADGDLSLRLTDHGIPIPRILWIVLDDEVKVRFRFVAGTPAGERPPGTGTH
jgi:polyisoprenoid-binding protein YceI